MDPHRPTHTPSARGFSLIELVMVILIIFLIAALAIPRVLDWMAMYRLRAGARQLFDDINTGRTKAIGRNVNWGVNFVIAANNQSYALVIEDDQTYEPTHTSVRQPMNTLIADPAQRVDRARPPALRQLPRGIQFANAAQCTSVAGFTPNDAGFRFDRLGNRCDPGAAGAFNCPNLGLTAPAQQTLVQNNATESIVCVWDPANARNTWVRVSAGGRIRAQQ